MTITPEIVNGCELYLGDCLEVLPTLAAGSVDAVVTDPPYPNQSDLFIDGIPEAVEFLESMDVKLAFVFWSEVEHPPVYMPLVAVHIWYRTNVNGKIYEPIYHFDKSGNKRRSEIIKGAAIFDGAGAGCIEYEGHPTQKPKHVIRWILENYTKRGDIVFDPFMGSGTTGVACIQTGRRFIGIEKDPTYYAIAKRRILQAQPPLFVDAPASVKDTQLGLELGETLDNDPE